MNEKIKLILADDHQLFRDGLKKVLQESELFEIIAEASNGLEFLDLINKHNPDVVLMDISMPQMDGIEATHKAIMKKPDLKVIVLSMYDDQEYYYKMIHAGVKGFILKTSGKKEVENAIQLVYSGECYFSNDLLRNIIINYTPLATKSEVGKNRVLLTKREIEVLQYLCKGFSNCEIATKLNISSKTIDTHRLNLLSKTGSKTTVSLVMYAIKNKIIEV